MKGLDELREATAALLREKDLDAVTAWEPENRMRRKNAVVAVSLRECQGGPAGLQDYLGEWYDSESEQWEELYGKRAKLTLGLDIYAPENLGEYGCVDTFTRLVEALADGGPDGLRVETLSSGETQFQRESGLFRCPVQAVCQVYLYAKLTEDGEFTDFMVQAFGKSEHKGESLHDKQNYNP